MTANLSPFVVAGFIEEPTLRYGLGVAAYLVLLLGLPSWGITTVALWALQSVETRAVRVLLPECAGALIVILAIVDGSQRVAIVVLIPRLADLGVRLAIYRPS